MLDRATVNLPDGEPRQFFFCFRLLSCVSFSNARSMRSLKTLFLLAIRSPSLVYYNSAPTPRSGTSSLSELFTRESSSANTSWVKASSGVRFFIVNGTRFGKWLTFYGKQRAFKNNPKLLNTLQTFEWSLLRKDNRARSVMNCGSNGEWRPGRIRIA